LVIASKSRKTTDKLQIIHIFYGSYFITEQMATELIYANLPPLNNNKVYKRRPSFYRMNFVRGSDWDFYIESVEVCLEILWILWKVLVIASKSRKTADINGNTRKSCGYYETSSVMDAHSFIGDSKQTKQPQ
ncbi:hypothetical protein BB559_000168, partial [Furculomyces boomerangus]